MKSVALALVTAALAIAGCSNPARLGGDYVPRDPDRGPVTGRKRTIYDHSEFSFFWDLVDAGRFDAEAALQSQLGEGEAFTDIEVRDGSTIDGIILRWLTLGVVNHREVEILGRKVSLRPERSPPPRAALSRNRNRHQPVWRKRWIP